MDQIVWVASYPKSGNTWVRFLLANLIDDQVESSESIEQVIPDVHRPKRQPYVLEGGVGFMKTHFLVETLPDEIGTTAGIYVVRNPFDVAVSHLSYFELANRDEESHQFLDRYLRDGGLPRWSELGFGSWDEHVASWCFALQPFRRLIVKYEDLQQDTVAELKRITEFLEWKIDNERIELACQKSSFDSLKDMEAREIKAGRQGFFKSEQTAKSSQYRFMNQGVSGRGARMLTEQQQSIGTARFGVAMTRLGY